ncbi:MAG: Activator of Hsp90 ATPase 1 family protein [Caulobacteraceae bacterium]|nr:Activator of Hsp90 ATPase 1 family protein [Caulobacteraceae bacterium]
MTQDTPRLKPLFRTARFEGRDDRVIARFDMTLENPVEAVWAALTEAARFPDWLAPGEIDPRPGGAVKLNFVDSGIVIDSTISDFEPLRVLEYSWSRPGEPERPIRFELERVGATTELVLTIGVPASEDAARAAAGWAAHLEMLAAALAGAPIKFPFEVFKAAREDYRARVGCLQAKPDQAS